MLHRRVIKAVAAATDVPAALWRVRSMKTCQVITGGHQRLVRIVRRVWFASFAAAGVELGRWIGAEGSVPLFSFNRTLQEPIMKKHIVVLVVLASIGGTPSAQSSVTVFGVVDLNGRWLNNNGVKQYSLSQDGLQSSRLGFRGSEDMGVGLRAGFWRNAVKGA